MSDTLRDRLQHSLGASYSIERELGGGGMSRVFVADETRFGRRVVVKVLAPELAQGVSIERFEREIALAARLQHPNVVPVLTAGAFDDGAPYYTMPFIDGESLRHRIVRGALPVVEAVSILRDVARALAYAHGHGVVHRDVKPENVLLTGGAAVVADFGIAKALSAAKTLDGTRPERASGLTQVGTSLGTPAYMAPEQAVGDAVDHRADVYAWGVVAYELLAGRHPFADKATTQQLVAAHLSETPLPLGTVAPAVPMALASLVMRALAKDASARPQSATELIAALDSAATPTSLPVTPRWPSRTRVAIAAVVLLAAIAGGLLVLRARPSRPALEPKRVVVASFVNRSGDRTLDPLGAMAADWIARGLASTGVVDVAGTAADLASRGATKGDASLATLAADARAGIVISGAYYRQGDSVLFQADFTDAVAGKLVQSVGPVSATTARPLDGIERLRQRVTGGLASLVEPALGGLAGVAATPPSEEAYREMLAGEELFYRDEAAAIERYTRAAALDSTYAYPILRIATIYTNERRSREADSVARLIDARRLPLTPYERAYLDELLGDAHGDPDAVYRATVAMHRAAPKSAFAAYWRAIGAVRVARAHESDSIFATLDPTDGTLRGRIYFFSNWAIAAHLLGDHARELAIAQRGRRQYPGRARLMVAEIAALVALGRGDEVLARLDTVAAQPPDLGRSPIDAFVIAIYELRYHGHDAAADQVRARLLDFMATHRATDDPANDRTQRGRALLATEQWRALRSLADSMVRATPTDVEPLGWLGTAAAMLGDTAAARRVDARLATFTAPFDRTERSHARASIAAALGDSAAAFAYLRDVNPAGGGSTDTPHALWVLARLRSYAPLVAFLRPRS